MSNPRLPLFLLGPLLLLVSGPARAADPTTVQVNVSASPGTTDSSTSSVAPFVMPPSAELAYEEYVKNNDRIETLQLDIDKRIAALTKENDTFDANRKKLENALRVLTAVAGKCSTAPKDEDARKQQAEDVRQSVKALNQIVTGPLGSWLPKFDADFKVLCQQQAGSELTFLRTDQMKEFLDQVDSMRTKWVQTAQQELDGRTKEKDKREQLRGQFAGALNQLKKQIERTSNFSDLKWLVLILGVLSVTVMMIVRTFPVELQTEWVASGQVIQFMTVLIILIAILSLGINGILREDTLGTLLGGIGGYVLAQGVGRAALRNALSGTVNAAPAANSPPPPQKPPAAS